MAYDKNEIYNRVQKAVRSEKGKSLNADSLNRVKAKMSKAFISEFNRIKREWDVKCKFSDEDNRIEVIATLK